MGHKVHPTGFRVGVIYDWQSKWYAGKNYKEQLHSDIAIRKRILELVAHGRNTGDAQFFINLVDNPRLNFDYTVFAQVVAEDMDVVDRILRPARAASPA